MNKETIKQAYINGFMKAASAADAAARKAQNLLNPGLPQFPEEAGQALRGFSMPSFNQPAWLAKAREHVNAHPMAYGGGAGAVTAGSAASILGDQPSKGISPDLIQAGGGWPGAGAVADAGAGAGAEGATNAAGAGQADPSIIQQLLSSIKEHPYLWGGGAAAGLGLGALASQSGKKKEQNQQIPQGPVGY